MIQLYARPSGQTRAWFRIKPADLKFYSNLTGYKFKAVKRKKEKGK